MATFTRQVRTTAVVEFCVPTNELWGADWVEIYKAVAIARNELRAAGRHGPDEEGPDDLIRMHARDDHIAVCYEIEAVDQDRPVSGMNRYLPERPEPAEGDDDREDIKVDSGREDDDG